MALCPPDPAAKRLGRLHVGTAGFTNAHWAGQFYPPSAKKSELQLEHYQETFSVVEVNSTFYGTPSTDAISAWRRRSSDGFQIGLKVPKTVTHEAPFSAAALEHLSVFLSRAQGLGVALGPLLFQCSRQFAVDLQKLRTVAALLDAWKVPCRVAFEFRDASWHRDAAVLAFMRERNWAMVQHPNTLGRATVGNSSSDNRQAERYPIELLADVATADFAYCRLHGDNDGHSYCYSDEELMGYASQVHAWRVRGLDVYCFLLNDSAEAAMPKNAKRLMEIAHGLASEPVPRGPALARQRTLNSFFCAGAAQPPPTKRPRVIEIIDDDG